MFFCSDITVSRSELKAFHLVLSHVVLTTILLRWLASLLQMKKQRFRGVKQLTRLRSHGFSLMESVAETLISSRLKLKASHKEIFSNMNIVCERDLSYKKLPYDFCTH